MNIYQKISLGLVFASYIIGFVPVWVYKSWLFDLFSKHEVIFYFLFVVSTIVGTVLAVIGHLDDKHMAPHKNVFSWILLFLYPLPLLNVGFFLYMLVVLGGSI